MESASSHTLIRPPSSIGDTPPPKRRRASEYVPVTQQPPSTSINLGCPSILQYQEPTTTLNLHLPPPREPLPDPTPRPTPSLGPTNPIFHSTQSPLNLTVGCYNLAGASITLDRFQQVVIAISELPQPPSIIALSEFKPTGEPVEAFSAAARLASAGRYHLVASPGAPTDGIAMLISSDLSHSGPHCY